jgi:hypothetical protein
MLSLRDIWLEEDWQAIFVLIPFLYSGMSCCVIQHNIGCEMKRAPIRWTVYELLRWSIIVTMVYGWWNVYMFTVLHSLIWGWSILEITYIKSRVTFI